MKTKISASACGGVVMAVLLAMPAVAGGLVEPTPEASIVAAVPAQQAGGNWSGGWGALKLGYGDGSTGAASGTGMTYGIGAGYDWDFGKWVLGAAADWDNTNIDLGAAPDGIDNVMRLKLRAGADLGRTLVYATAGPARAKATIGGVSASDNGWFGGVGADYMLNDRWTLGGEILANRFNNFGASGTDLKATTASVNLGLRF